ncbi:MAG: hypothetical protein QF593_12670, partial [Nitrospinota bacterium]|nr:hypothetical protein [Nitrospinota bacterium]
ALPPAPAETRGPAARSVEGGWIDLAQRRLPSTGSGASRRSQRKRLDKGGTFTRPCKRERDFHGPRHTAGASHDAIQ